MMQGYLKQFLLDRASVYSAGTETHGVNPLAIKVMKDDGIDISNHTSNNVSEYKNLDFDFVITVCDNAKEICPYFKTKAKLLHHSFPDPATAKGNKTKIYTEFTKVRDMIKEFCSDFSNSI